MRVSLLTLKPYQERCLASLVEYFRAARTHGAKHAFMLQTERPYRSVPELPDLPYVCLRLPTGGGKTLLACHAVGIAAREFLHAERVVCLWLVPSNAIREQTLAALRDRDHFYRQALESRLPGSVRVMDLREALYLQRAVLDGESVVVVSTLAALRVQDTEGRKVYETSGALDHHFSGLRPEQLESLELDGDGSFQKSLANVLRLRRPIVIMDEAHNARTTLSFETLARVLPSVIVELTATPAQEHRPQQGRFASNVIYHSSAAELKQAEMVKLPIELVTRRDWQEVVQDAIAKQRELERLSESERQATGERIRPIVLLQAQPRRQRQETLSVEKLREALIRDFAIAEEQIAIEAYDRHDLEDVNLESDDCPVRYILTVQKLREGWDCPWAYVLCSVADQTSATAVEQILGRILRLPQARAKREPALNRAYAFASSADFVRTAQSLKDALVDSGFEPLEVDRWVIGGQQQAELHLSRRVPVPATDPPDLTRLVPELAVRVRYEGEPSELVVEGSLTPLEVEAVAVCFAVDETRAEVRRAFGLGAPHVAGFEPIRVPRLAVKRGEQLTLLEEDDIAEETWTLPETGAELSESVFPTRPASPTMGMIDIAEDDAQLQIVPFSDVLERSISLLEGEPGWATAKLANWLDQQIYHPDLTQVEFSTYALRVVEGLIASRDLDIGALARQRFRLRAALARRVEELRQQAREEGLQRLLFGGEVEVVTSSDVALVFEESSYAPGTYYEGAYQFRKHLFPGRIGDLADEGEEFRCAIRLDDLEDVECWVRNLAGPGSDRERTSFWLQTPAGKFYPDFVARLADGRSAVVEYKGAHIASGPKEQDKRRVGELWADRSEGRCVFAFVGREDLDRLPELLRSKATTES